MWDFSLRESKAKFANVCCITKLLRRQAHCLIPSIWIPNLPSCEQMSEHVSSLVDLVWIAGAFMQLSTIYIIKKLGTWLPQQEWKTLLLPQALISQPVAEFVHLAEP